MPKVTHGEYVLLRRVARGGRVSDTPSGHGSRGVTAPDLEVFHQLLQRHLCDQADVQGTGDRLTGLGLKLLSHLVEVKLLVPKMQGLAVPLLTKQKETNSEQWPGENLSKPEV